MSDPQTSTGAGLGEGSAPVEHHPLVVGLDLSLTSTGVAHYSAGSLVTESIPSSGTGIVRLRNLATRVAQMCTGAELVVIEGPAYSSVGGQSDERSGLWWMVQDRLWTLSKPVAVITPGTLKAYATNNGNAGKDVMLLAAARRFPSFDGDNNAADAAWLAVAGYDYLTGDRHVPKVQRDRLDKVQWPTITRGAA